jgi:hypothetical protein
MRGGGGGTGAVQGQYRGSTGAVQRGRRSQLEQYKEMHKHNTTREIQGGHVSKK